MGSKLPASTLRPGLAIAALLGGFALVAASAPAAEPTDPAAPSQVAQAAAQPAQGAAASPQQAQPAPPKGIEEVVVTARKREERLIEVPASVSAFESVTIRELGVSDPTDISNLTPNLSLTRNITTTLGTTVFMRGLGRTDMAITEDPFVGLYVDGVYLGKSVGSLFDILDLERIEVLRGPQGTLYGKNTVGGAVNFVTRKPSGEWGISLDTETGNHAYRMVKVSLDFPVVEGKLAGLATFLRRERNGFGKDPVFEQSFDNEDTVGARVALRWTPTDELTFDYAFDWNRIDQGPAQNFLTGVTRNDPGCTNPLVWNAIDTVACLGMDPSPFIHRDRKDLTPVDAYPVKEDMDVFGHSLIGTWELGSVPGFDELTLTSVTGFRRIRNESFIDADGTPIGIWEALHDTRLHQFSQELRANFRTLDSRIDGVFGLYYFRQKGNLENIQGLLQAIGLPAMSGEPAGFPNLMDIEDDTESVFADVTFHLTDRLSIGGGVRYDLEHKEIDRFQHFPPAPILDFSGDVTFVNWSPKATISYRWTEDLTTYFTAARAFRSGGFNGRALLVQDMGPTDDALVTSFEVGFKSRFWEERVELNADGFYQRGHKLQFQLFDPVSGAVDQRIANVDRVDYWGVEAELAAHPIEGLEITSAFGFIDPEFRKFIDPKHGDVKGFAKFQYAPHYTYHGTVRYALPPFRFGTLRVRVDYYAQSRVSFLTFSSDEIDQGKYSLLDARIELGDLRLPNIGGKTSVYLWGKNLTNREYRSGGIDWGALGFLTNVYGPPRTFGVGLSFDWGSRES